jgi:hypothetical protein
MLKSLKALSLLFVVISNPCIVFSQTDIIQEAQNDKNYLEHVTHISSVPILFYFSSCLFLDLLFSLTVFSSLSYSLLLIFLALFSSSHLLFSFLPFSIFPIFSLIIFFCYSCYELFLRRFLSECRLHIFLL